MGKKIVLNKSDFLDNIGILTPGKGGTGVTSNSELKSSIGIVDRARRNAPNGVAGLEADGKLSSSVIPSDLNMETITIDGNATVNVSTTATYTIVGYSSFNTYTITVSAGTVNRTGATITYNAPSTAQTVTMTINGKEFILNVVPVTAYITTPSVTSPINGATQQNADVSFTSSAFSVSGGSDTHQGSDWQVATDTSFSNIVSSVINSTTHKTSWNVTGLILGTTYYVRVKHKGTNMGYSNWSNTNTFTTKTSYGIGTEHVKWVGETTGDNLGYSVSINSSGDTVAIGADSSNSSRKGYVKVYKLISSTWTLQGAKLEGETINDAFGIAISLNSAGDIVAIGASYATINSNVQTGYVKVYKLISGTWTLQGTRIDGEVSSEYFGNAVSINSAGDILATASANSSNSTGYVKIYKNISGIWTLQGAKILGEAASDNFGRSVSINNIGDVVVIGAYYANTGTGYVKIYKNISGTWTLQGSKILGDSNSSFGKSVSINDAGDIIAVGADNFSVNSGYVEIYKNISGTWTLQGTRLSGEAVNDRFGISVSLNSTGDTVIIGAHIANTGTGYVKIYKNISGTWTLQGSKITGEVAWDYFGMSVSINNAGDTVAVGAWAAGNQIGYVKIYK
jgi:hypothetical protein